MISTEQANEYVRGMADEEVRLLARDRLLGADVSPVGGGYHAEPAEDLLIQLLRHESLPDATRRGIIAGCREVYAQLHSWLVSRGTADAALDGVGVAVRLCRLVDVAGPAELAHLAQSELYASLDVTVVPPEVRAACVRAAMAYVEPGNDAQASLWMDVIEYPDVAAYALNALLIVDPRHPRIEQSLIALFRHQVLDDWAVDTPFLMRRAARARSNDAIVGSVLLSLRSAGEQSSEAARCWEEVQKELDRRPWSRVWNTPSGESAPTGIAESLRTSTQAAG